MRKLFSTSALALCVLSVALGLSSCGGGAAVTEVGGPGGATGGSGGGGTTGTITQLNHIVILVQENRSFDHYFGKINDYRAANGLGRDVDGLPANASNPQDNGTQIPAYKLRTVCIENVSPAWNESHKDYNLSNPSSNTATMDGFVSSAAGIATFFGFQDTSGKRAMGYYDNDALPYYYFMATNFAMSDRFFSPAPTNSTPNRMFIIGGTSGGYKDIPPNQVPNKTLFEMLDSANVTWKIYVTDPNPSDPTNLKKATYLQFFTYINNASVGAKIVPVSQYYTDVAAGTLPNVALIETGQFTGRDEHPGSLQNIQTGAAYAADLINKLMASPSWKDSAFIWTMDEAGGLYDHVPPPAAVPPDGVTVADLQPGDTPGGFDRTGFRIPMFIASPFARKNYVSHTSMDTTAIIKLISTRWSLPGLTSRDKAQADMSEFFNFAAPPWATPPTPPAQPQTAPCDNNLP